ncbi:DUF6056 family protein [Dysgonomonas sp. 25]|uniref:DUF3329 domain-containing protein n=1 Tax=Dysgonomonas sp. 25 TaxID=2302933 RepID=UPI001C882354|nr:DUF6056 family protein [Dysgonomonas sp. 25]
MEHNKENKIVLLSKRIYNRLDALSLSLPENKAKYAVLWGGVVLFFFGLILLMNVLTPMIADDFCYLFIYGDFETKVTSLSDIVLSQKNHYYMWGGRSVVHFIAQALLLLPPLVIDILNTFVYLAYAGLIYLLAKGRGRNSLSLFILINIAVWFMQPAFGDTILWITGSANYLWGSVLILLFLLPYRMYEGTKDKLPLSIAKLILFFLFGIIAGWTNENTAAAMIVIAALFLVYYRSHKWAIPAWAFSALAGAIVGYLIMILAPGNQMRAGEASTLDPMVIAYRFIMHTISFVNYCGVLNILYIICGVLAYYFARSSRNKPLNLSFIFFAGVLAAVYSMIFSPSFPPRAWFGVITFNIVALGILFYHLDFKAIYFRQMRNLLLAALGVAFLFSAYPAFKDLCNLHQVVSEREQLADEAKAQGRSYVEFERYNAKSKFVHSEDPKAYEFMYGYYDIEVRFKE